MARRAAGRGPRAPRHGPAPDPGLAVNLPILNPLHRAAGARFADSEPPLLLTYGSVPDEYRAGTEGALLLDETDRGRVVVRGGERAEFLHRMLANDVRGLPAGGGNRNLLLTPKGKVRFVFDLAVEPDRVLLSTPPGQAAPLAEALEMYHFSEDVELVDGSEDHAPLALVGPRAGALLDAVLGIDPPTELHATVAARFEDQPVDVVALPVAGSPGFRVDGGPRLAERLWRALVAAGATPGGRVVRDILRVEACAADPVVDVDDTIYPQEARLEGAFHLEKGCYVGQEVVAKIDTYGGLNKRLVALRLSHDDPVAPGTRLVLVEDGEERDLGVVTSWAYSFALDTGLCLAYVKRKHQTPGHEFRLAGSAGTATVVEVPVRAGALALTGEPE